MSAAWLTPPVTLTGSREFTCDSFGFTQEQCDYYQQRWHFWFIADRVFALSTIAFLMSVLGIFKVTALTRYLSYRGFHVQALRWESAPLGLLLLAAVGTIFFFCMDLIPQPYYWPSLDFGGSPPLGTRSGWMALACMPFVLHYFIATAAVYVPCYVYPWLRTCFEYGTRAKAQVTVEDGGFTRISIPANFTWIPGQHCFLRFTGFGFFQALSAHPFTICSLPSRETNERSELIFYIRHQRGLTARLHQTALENPGSSIPVLVDGPYGGINQQSYAHSDHLLVIAGGSGAGWTLPFIEQFVLCQSKPFDEERGQAADLESIEKKTKNNECSTYGRLN
ncbi:hypothetical protein TrVFT333_010696 [Trichoderma virens FT-333]|nr:hypothetical protein TrVFT333_010696 [Trichoderma virens FT-333]